MQAKFPKIFIFYIAFLNGIFSYSFLSSVNEEEIKGCYENLENMSPKCKESHENSETVGPTISRLFAKVRCWVDRTIHWIDIFPNFLICSVTCKTQSKYPKCHWF